MVSFTQIVSVKPGDDAVLRETNDLTAVHLLLKSNPDWGNFFAIQGNPVVQHPQYNTSGEHHDGAHAFAYNILKRDTTRDVNHRHLLTNGKSGGYFLAARMAANSIISAANAAGWMTLLMGRQVNVTEVTQYLRLTNNATRYVAVEE
jgi:hypothetical protein